MLYYWLVAIIISYLFFGLGAFFDKLALAGKPKPKSYTFYVGIFGLVVALILIPFITLRFPTSSIGWILLDAFVRILGLYAMFVAVEKFDISKVIPTIGATQPIFIFILTWVFWGPQIMPASGFIAFGLLFLGSIIISVEKTPKITAEYLKITLFSSAMFSLDYIFAKMVYLDRPFLEGMVWVNIFVCLLALFFLIKKDSRKEIFERKMISDKKTQSFFISAQLCGGVANFLQGFAISLAPVVFLATINSLRGIQYIALFIITLISSIFFPRILKEKLTGKIFAQKFFSIGLIVMGLAILIAY